MAGTSDTELTASIAILGLIVRRPDTLAGLRVRVAQGFPGVERGRSTAYNTLKSLRDQRLVHVAGIGARKLNAMLTWQITSCNDMAKRLRRRHLMTGINGRFNLLRLDCE
jgi:hypothetical protein